MELGAYPNMSRTDITLFNKKRRKFLQKHLFLDSCVSQNILSTFLGNWKQICFALIIVFFIFFPYQRVHPQISFNNKKDNVIFNNFFFNLQHSRVVSCFLKTLQIRFFRNDISLIKSEIRVKIHLYFSWPVQPSKIRNIVRTEDYFSAIFFFFS